MTETMNCEPPQETRSAISTLIEVSSFSGDARALHANSPAKRELRMKRMMDGWKKEKRKKGRRRGGEAKREKAVKRRWISVVPT